MIASLVIMPLKLVKSKKGRYVKVGKKKIYVNDKMSERELIKWMVETFLKKKRRKRSTATTKKSVIHASSATTGVANQALLLDDRQQTRRELEQVRQDLLKASADMKQLKPASTDTYLVRGQRMTGHQIENGLRQVEQAFEEKEKEMKEKDEKIKEQNELLHDQLQVADDLKQKNDEQVKESQRIQLETAETQRQNNIASLTNDIILADRALESALADGRKKLLLVDHLRERAAGLGLNPADGPAGSRTQDGQFKASYLRNHSQIKPLITVEALNEELKATDEDVIQAQHILDNLTHNLNELDNQDPQQQLDLENILMQGDGRLSHDLSQGMSSDQINAIMDKYKPDYLGCIAADEIHLLRPKKSTRICWVMNTDPRGQPGSHWVACLIDARPHGSHSVEYYDSLAEPIRQGWVEDLKKIIKRVHGDESYLRFKENGVADQSDTSNNCGEFACRFLQARLDGETFGQASGWNSAGERKIEQWKKKMWISSQKGEGFRDIFNRVRDGAKRVIQRIKDTLGGPRAGPSPSVRGWLEKYGDVEIETIHACKKPVFSILEKIGNWVTNNKIRENMDRLGYDRMMHLWLSIKLKNGMTVKIEKNQIVEIKMNAEVGRENVFVPVKGSPTGRTLFEGAQKRVGADNLWKYDLVKRNCQKFVLWFLDDMVTPEIHEFVEQNVEETLKDMGLLKRVATAVTDLAATADVALNGAGITAHHMDAIPVPTMRHLR